MFMAKVIGTVVATKKDDTLVGSKLLVVRSLGNDLRPKGEQKVLVDSVGAGVGELVLCVSGAAARNAVRSRDAAIDGAVVGIIDEISIS